MDTMPCPSCDKYIPINAVKCRCGWEAKKNTRVPCAFSGCIYEAKERHKMPTGWANLCWKHVMEIHQERADHYCDSLGMKTVEQKRDWLRKSVLKIKKIPATRASEREPGCDDEEIETYVQA